MKKLTLLLTTLLTQQLFALISIVPVEIGVEPGYSGNIAASLETKRGNTHKDNYKIAAKLSYDNNKDYVTWGEISGEYGKSNNVKDTSKIYLHLRYIHALSNESLRAEAFTQIQDNEFKLIKRRLLGGAGVRMRLFETADAGKGYLGLGGFFEQVRYTSIDPEEDNFRANIYFAYASKIGDDSTLSYNIYYQPNTQDFSDYITAQALALKLHIYKRLFLKFQIAYDSDSVAPIGVQKYDFTQTSSFVFNF